jgi:SET domain-containing protein
LSKINQDYAWFRLKLIKSPIHRYGVITEEKIPARRYVIEYTGVLYNRKAAKQLFEDTPEENLIYIWQIGDPWYWLIDGRTGGSGAEFINHSCDPNLTVRFHGHRVYYVARRSIKKGEELTVDYNFDWAAELVVCSCRSKKCRGYINVKDKN